MRKRFRRLICKVLGHKLAIIVNYCYCKRCEEPGFMTKMKMKDIKSDIKVKVKKGSLPACMVCLPPAPLEGHMYFNGIVVHSRIDCQPGMIYFMNESELTNR